MIKVKRTVHRDPASFKMNKCRYGISGKGCNFKHDAPCNKILKHGLGGRLGCDGKCGKFHPQMCRNSLRNKECFRKECTYKHLPNTKRKEDDISTKINNPPRAKETSRNEANEGSKKATEDAFLEMKKELLDHVLQVIADRGFGPGMMNPQFQIPNLQRKNMFNQQLMLPSGLMTVPTMNQQMMMNQ